MEKKTSKVASGIKYFIVIIIFINVLAGIVPSLLSAWDSFRGGQDTDVYSNLEIAGVSAQIVPEYAGVTADEGYQMYRFDVTVNNKGTREEQVDYALYVNSGDGYVFEQTSGAYTDLERNVTDTRIIPRGRTAVITLYAQVSDDSTTVEFNTYCTPDDEMETYTYALPDTAV